MRSILPLLISLFVAFVCPIIISAEFKFLSGRDLGMFGSALSMICCILFAIGIYPRLDDHFRKG